MTAQKEKFDPARHTPSRNLAAEMVPIRNKDGSWRLVAFEEMTVADHEDRTAQYEECLAGLAATMAARKASDEEKNKSNTPKPKNAPKRGAT